MVNSKVGLYVCDLGISLPMITPVDHKVWKIKWEGGIWCAQEHKKLLINLIWSQIVCKIMRKIDPTSHWIYYLFSKEFMDSIVNFKSLHILQIMPNAMLQNGSPQNDGWCHNTLVFK